MLLPSLLTVGGSAGCAKLMFVTRGHKIVTPNFVRSEPDYRSRVHSSSTPQLEPVALYCGGIDALDG